MRHTTINLLLIEDDDIDAMSIERAFSKFHIDVAITRARDGVEALDIMQANRISRPYLVLLDLNLPTMNGHQFLDTLRRDSALRNTVIFIITSSSSQADIYTCYEKNIAGYIIKNSSPSTFNDLASLLDDYWNTVILPNKSSNLSATDIS